MSRTRPTPLARFAHEPVPLQPQPGSEKPHTKDYLLGEPQLAGHLESRVEPLGLPRPAPKGTSCCGCDHTAAETVIPG